jgi:hypothetical protein
VPDFRKIDGDQNFAIIAGGSRQAVTLDDGARGLDVTPSREAISA